MGDFNWNLGTDDAAEVSPNTAPSSAVPAIVVPFGVARPSIAPSNAAQVSPVRADQVHQEVAPQAMSRRELRNRRAAEAAVRPHVVESLAVEAHAESHAELPDAPVSQAEPLAEFFQLAEPAVDDAPVGSARSVAESRRAAKSRAKAVRAGKARARKGSVRKESVRTRAAHPAGHARPPRRQSVRKVGGRRQFFSKLFSVGTMVGIAAIMVSTSLPANAFYSTTNASGAVKATTSQSQSMKVASTVTEPAVNRDAYTVSSLLEQLKLKYGSRNFSYTNDINGTIQWPFPVPVPITSGFGPRIAPCGGCSSMHEGIDFTPGRGVAIGAIADGVVSDVVYSHGGLGNHVVVDHVINGQLVQSVYGHMLDGSITVTIGQAVKVTQKLGEVGSTGESTGPHLHLEIHINGVPIDPFAWLKANAN